MNTNMSHVAHITKNKSNLELRFLITKLVREFFWSKNFTEVETPLIVKYPGQEPYLSPMSLKIHNEKSEEFNSYLHTSPEYTMKKMLSAGFENIFSICKCFRDFESFGGTHNPEFTMIEWYRTKVDYFRIMEDVEGLFNYILDSLINNFKFEILNFKTILNNQIFKFERMTMKELWEKYVGVNLDEFLTQEKMLELCRMRGYKPREDENFEDLFYWVFLNEIEPKLVDQFVIIYEYPAQMAALARLSKKDSRYAERFEVYINGLELANAFSELNNAEEQLQRLKEEQDLRKKLGKEVYEIDREFVEALKTMPESAGIALGVDRLVQFFGGLQNIDNVIVLPSAKLFE